MKCEATALFLMLGLAVARPDVQAAPLKTSAKFRREVPQEQSHKKFLTGVKAALELNNVDKIVDPVFALLGNAAAAKGAGAVKDLDCLQQRVADQAFTNAKAANDIEGMTNALVFRALERNTGKVGLASVLCTSETAKNPEIAALQQHQDPASAGAAAKNKEITLELARQLASIGADPQIALESGTFAPGNVNDNTGKGNTCDDENDAVGCIDTQNLRVDDATAAEIDAAVAGGAGGNNNNNAGNGNVNNGNGNAGNGTANAGNGNNNNNNGNANTGNANDGCNVGTGNANAGNGTGNANTGNGNNNNAGNNDAAAGTNVNKFTGSLGADAIPINKSNGNRPFEVNGSTFINLGAAAQRACDVQKNQCANAVNTGSIDGSVADCDAQQKDCLAANTA